MGRLNRRLHRSFGRCAEVSARVATMARGPRSWQAPSLREADMARLHWATVVKSKNVGAMMMQRILWPRESLLSARAIRRIAAAATLAASVSVSATPALAAGWNVVKQFSHFLNPNGQWTYLTNAPPLKPVTHYDRNKNVAGWWTDQPVPNNLYISSEFIRGDG